MVESKTLTNPFPGLRPFETDEYRLFFGREGQSDALITRLQRARFLAVVGTSGSGKSSLVRAGLLPALRGGMMAGAGSGWRISIMRPGSDPFGNLAHSLAENDVLPEAGAGLPPAEAEAVIEAQLRSGSLGLVDVAKNARLAENEKLLVVVDQFEELFRFRSARATTSTGDDASAFVKLLLEAAQQRELSIYVVLTMRSDFLGDCAQFQGLPEAINDGQYLIPRMTRDERRMAVTGPVGVTRGKIAEPLINRLLNDVGDNPDQLPILQHALMRTWDYWATHRRDSEPIGLVHYESIGTMSDALSLHADEAWDELPDERSRRLAEKLFKALTEKGADNREIRRPTRLSEIAAAAEVSEPEVVAVIDVFRRDGRSFLMPPAAVELSSETVIDISHESLIRNWDRLQKWVEEEAQSARVYRRLSEAAVLHQEGSEGLLQDPALQIALDWCDKNKPNAAWANRYNPRFDESVAYLEQSRAARDLALAERERQRNAELERERREREQAERFAAEQARAARRLRWLAVGMAVMFLLALGTAAYGLHARSDAKSAEKDAKSAEKIARDAQAEAERAAREVAEGAARLKVEKDKADLLALNLGKEEVKTEQALIAQKAATAHAAEQSRIAAENSQRAENAAREAVANAEQFKAAVERNGIIRGALEAFRRTDYEVALKQFEDLRKRLEPLQPGAPLVKGQQRTPEEYRQFVIDLGWTDSNIGTTHRAMGSDDQSVVAFEKALETLKPLTAKGDPISKDLLMFETFSGLGYAYHQIALTGTRRDPAPSFVRSETFLKQALQFRQSRALDKRKEVNAKLQGSGTFERTRLLAEATKTEEDVAAGMGDLARLYHDAGRLAEAEQYFIRAAEHLTQNHASPVKIVAAIKEMAEFYRDQTRFDDAVRVYNQLIGIQDKDVGYDSAAVRDLADAYSDLGQVYAAQHDDDSANRNYKVASLLQQVLLKYRKEQAALEDEETTNADPKAVITIDDDLDALADAYLEIDRLPQAEETYNSALEIRRKFKAADGERWKSYAKLGDMFANQIRDLDYAQHHTEEKYSGAYKKAVDYYYMLVGFYESSPNQSQVNYLDGLRKLGSLYAKDPSTYPGAEQIFGRAMKLIPQMPKRVTQSEMAKYEALSAAASFYKDQNKVVELEAAYLERLKVLEGFLYLNYTVRDAKSRDYLKALHLYAPAIGDLKQFYITHDRAAEVTALYARMLKVDKNWFTQIGNPNVLAAYIEYYDALAKSLEGQNRDAEKAAALERSERAKAKLARIKGESSTEEKKDKD